tara:strand:+ start:152 stop:547 length:396 start_codon:yes stop_codon:yes gene_type:complete
MPESEKKNYKDGSERVAMPANLSKPKLKWKISVEEANRYGLDVLKGIIPFIFIIVMCFEVSNYISDNSEDIVDPNNKGDGENIIRVLDLISELFNLAGWIFILALAIGLLHKILGDVLLRSFKNYHRARQK